MAKKKNVFGIWMVNSWTNNKIQKLKSDGVRENQFLYMKVDLRKLYIHNVMDNTTWKELQKQYALYTI